MRAKKKIVFSVIVSLGLHMAFVSTAAQVDLPTTFTKPIEEKRQLFKVKTLRSRIPERRTTRRQIENINDREMAEKIKFQSPAQSEFSKAFIESKENIVKEDNITTEVKEQAKPVVVSLEEYFDSILNTKNEYKAIKKIAQRETRKDLVEVSATTKDGANYSSSEQVLEQAQITEDFYEKMPGFTPELRVDLDAIPSENILQNFINKNFGSAIRRQNAFANLDEYLISELYTWEDPTDEQKYFKVSIRVGKDAQFNTIPKEIVFLIDSSISIKKERLDEVKDGLRFILANLNKGDKFNIAAFKKNIQQFQKKSVEPSKKNIEEALAFIDDLTAGEKTDTYNALYKSINTEDIMDPSYIILFSDGRATQGETDSRKIINEISKLNKGRVGIFAFSGGLRVNRYLLDFIAYKNRGWSEHSNRTNLIDQRLTNMYKKIQDPILLNLRYRMSGLNQENIFPKLLPDFFRGTEFTLYGKFSDEDEFVVQLLGDLTGETNELIVHGSLKDGLPGGPEIAKNWAFNKVYHLISQLGDTNENKQLISEINSLSKKFEIKTPYSKAIK